MAKLIEKRQIENLQIKDIDVAPGAAIATNKLEEGGKFVKSDGTIPFLADQSMSTHKITDLAEPVNDNDALRLIDLTDYSDSVDTKLNDYQLRSEKDLANGYAGLDTGGKVLLSQLPDAILGQLEYQGQWDAATNTPTLPDPTIVKGHYYVTQVAGTQFGHDYGIGDWVVSDGSKWDYVDNSDSVTTVFGRLGAILANSDDYSAFYYPLSANPSGYITTSSLTAYALKDGTNATGIWPIGISGDAATATKLITARTINGVAFDGTANIVIPTGGSEYELLANKSTLTSLGTSNTLYPTQGAVKSYVDGLMSGKANLDGSNFFANGNQMFYDDPTSTYIHIVPSSGTVTVQSGFDTKHASIGFSGIYFNTHGTFGNAFAHLKSDNLSATVRTFQVPDASGTLVISVNGQTPNVNGNVTLTMGGTVSSVTSANTDIGVTSTTTTPVLTLNSGSGANQIVKRDGSGIIPDLANYVNTTSPQTIGGTKTFSSIISASAGVNAASSISLTSGINTLAAITPLTFGTISRGTIQLYVNNTTGPTTANVNILPPSPLNVSVSFTLPNQTGTAARLEDLTNFAALTGNNQFTGGGSQTYFNNAGGFISFDPVTYNLNIENPADNRFVILGFSGIQFSTNAANSGYAVFKTDDIVTTAIRTFQLPDTNGTLTVKSTDTAPTSSTSAGKNGTVIISGGFRYECIADNSWVRLAVSTF